MKTIKTGKDLGAVIDAIFQESIKSSLHKRALKEKENQQNTADLFKGGKSSGDDTQATNDSQEDQDKSTSKSDQSDSDTDNTTSQDAEHLESGDISSKDVIEKLNSIRSGRSFKDSAIEGNMQKYIDALNVAEKTSLLSFLKGIAQIVTGEIPAQQASEPESKPANVRMKKVSNEPDKIRVKPNVIKNAPTQDKKPQPGHEDTTAPKKVPITPKK